MAGFLAALGGAGQAAQQYGQQQRQINAEQQQQLRQIGESQRHDFQNLIANTITQPGISPEFKGTLFGLGGDLAAGKNIGPIIQNFQKSFAKEQQGNTAFHQATGTAAPEQAPMPTPGSAPGIVPGKPIPAPPPSNGLFSAVSGNQDQGAQIPDLVGIRQAAPAPPPAAQPATSLIQPQGRAIQAPAAPASAPIALATAQPNELTDQFQLTSYEEPIYQKYLQELASPFGASAQTSAAVAPIFQRMAQLGQLRGQAAVDVEKSNSTFQQNLRHLAQLYGPDYAGKLAPEMLTEFLQTGQVKPLPLMNPGQIQMGINGKEIARSPFPKIEIAPEGSQPIAIGGGSTPPPLGAVSNSSSLTPPPTGLPSGVTALKAIPPKLTPDEELLRSAAEQTAQSHGIPFDRTVNPRDPLGQLPTAMQLEASRLHKQMTENPLQQQLSEASLRMDNLRAEMLQGSLPTPDDIHDTAQDILHGRMAPSQLRTMSGYGQAGSSLRNGVMREIHNANPDFNLEAAESNYNFGHSPAFQQTIRYMDYADSTIDNTIKNANTLANSNFTSYNKLRNAVKGEFQSVDLAKFNTDRLETADAIAKILQGGTGSGTSDKKLADAQGILRESDSPQKVAATLKEVRDLIGNRKRSYTAGTYMGESPLTALPTSGPPQSIVNSTKEGQYIHSADGAQTWKKISGKAVLQSPTVH